MPRDRVPGYTGRVPPPPDVAPDLRKTTLSRPLTPPPRQKTPLGLTDLTRAAIRSATPQPGRSLTPHTTSIGSRREDPDDERTPPATPVARTAAELEQLRNDLVASEARAYLHADSRVEQCRAKRTGQTTVWVALGVAILAAVGSIATAIGVAVVDNAGEKVTARALNETAKATAGVQEEIARLRRELLAMRDEQREDRADILARIAARPLPRQQDVVRPRPEPEKSARRIDPEIEAPKDYGINGM